MSLDRFSLLRRKNRLYVDKTQRLAELADRHDWVFLARPRRMHAGVPEEVHAEGMPSGAAAACVHCSGTACAIGAA
ncbi:MAG: AAA family ATPase [Desulfovibrio sp.]|nr:AAA family ATPase [Desulfovibrio sp.]